jgi:cytochrome c-type biogenesis protein CcmH
MTVFWSLAAVMLMVALLFVLPPLMRQRKVSAVTLDDLNTKVSQEQLAELDADLAIGKLDKAQYDAARKDIERELLYDLVSADSAQTVAPERSGRWLVLLLIPALPLCAVLLYQLMGTGELIDILQQSKASQSASVNKQSEPAHSLDEMAAQLAERLRSEPDDLQGWIMLARTYNILRRPAEVARAYENVFRLGGDNDPDILANYVDSSTTINGGEFTDQGGELLLRALELDPNHLKALWLTGHWKNQSGRYAEAIQYWQKAAQQLPAGSENATIMAQQISNAQSQLGTSGTAIATTAGDQAADNSGTKAALSIHVTLDPALNAAVAPEDTVFIFARATQGSRMPLAIVRKQVKDLPVTVTLDDSLAMTPQMVLSKFENVTIGARVSKSGGAMPQSGDLQGLVSPIATQTSDTVQLTISSKVP